MNRPSESSANIPMLASARSTRYSMSALHAGRFTELFRMFWTIGQEIGNAQFRRNENRLRRPIAADQLIHLSLEICWS